MTRSVASLRLLSGFIGTLSDMDRNRCPVSSESAAIDLLFHFGPPTRFARVVGSMQRALAVHATPLLHFLGKISIDFRQDHVYLFVRQVKLAPVLFICCFHTPRRREKPPRSKTSWGPFL